MPPGYPPRLGRSHTRTSSLKTVCTNFPRTLQSNSQGLSVRIWPGPPTKIVTFPEESPRDLSRTPKDFSNLPEDPPRHVPRSTKHFARPSQGFPEAITRDWTQDVAKIPEALRNQHFPQGSPGILPICPPHTLHELPTDAQVNRPRTSWDCRQDPSKDLSRCPRVLDRLPQALPQEVDKECSPQDLDRLPEDFVRSSWKPPKALARESSEELARTPEACAEIPQAP